jgi:hypothetical protein
VTSLVMLQRIEAELADAYESACMAAETLEVPQWADLGAKIAAALADVQAELDMADGGLRLSDPLPTAGPDR